MQPRKLVNFSPLGVYTALLKLACVASFNFSIKLPVFHLFNHWKSFLENLRKSLLFLLFSWGEAFVVTIFVNKFVPSCGLSGFAIEN